MSEDYSYTAFGLKIRSNFPFPEFVPEEFEKEDLRISLNLNTDKEIKQVDWHKNLSMDGPDGYLFQVASVARYMIRNGNEILVESFEGGDFGAVRLYLLSNAMAILLIQRGQILLHASAIRFNEGLVAFIGDSGVGKSTMLAELIKRGYEPFSDDVLVLEEDPDSGEIIAIPSYPMMKLWKETIELIGKDNVGNGHRLRNGIEKFGHFFHEKFNRHPLRISQIFLLEKDSRCETYQFSEPRGLDSFEMLSRNIYRRQFIKNDQLRIKHLQLLGKLLAQSGFKVLRRPEKNSSIQDFVRFAEETFTKFYK